jgi:SHS2 domain-containing protein
MFEKIPEESEIHNTSMNEPIYEYLPHPADVRFRAVGHTLEQVFENAALAMFNVIINTGQIEPERSVDITLESQGLDNLLFDYLSELLYLFEVEEIIFGHFHVHSITHNNSNWKLEGQVMGESIDLTRHSFDTEVKAVTYHLLKVTKEDSGYSAHVIVDV